MARRKHRASIYNKSTVTYVTEAQKNQLKKLAKENHMSVSEYIRVCLQNYLNI